MKPATGIFSGHDLAGHEENTCLDTTLNFASVGRNVTGCSPKTLARRSSRVVQRSINVGVVCVLEIQWEQKSESGFTAALSSSAFKTCYNSRKLLLHWGDNRRWRHASVAGFFEIAPAALNTAFAAGFLWSLALYLDRSFIKTSRDYWAWGFMKGSDISGRFLFVLSGTSAKCTSRR